MTQLVAHTTGAYSYLPGGQAFSSGVVASAGHALVEWEFLEALPLADALARLDGEFGARTLGWKALVGLDLRSPAQFDVAGFSEFNEEYITRLREYYSLPDDALPPFTRTNITPTEPYLSEPAVRAVQVVVASPGSMGDFVLSGIAEVDGPPTPQETVAYRDISESGLRRKVEFVVAQAALRLRELGVSGTDARIVDVYTSHTLDWLQPLLADGIPAVGRHGMHLWPGRPPVVDLEFEMGCKRLSRRVVLD